MRRTILHLALPALLAACHPVAVVAVVTAEDATGASIELASPARRIVSLAPHATELLFAAGAGERIVGVLAPADWPPEAARVPRVGTAAGLDLERIVALKPDLAVVWPYLAPAHVERLRAMGIAVFVSDPRTPAAIAVELERLGTLAGTRASAARAAASFRARLSALDSHERGAAKVSVFYEIWHQPLYTVGGRHLITAGIRLCGGENVFGALAAPAPAVGIEDVLAARPEAIIAGTDNARRPVWLDEWKRWRELPAVARGNLFVVDANLLHRAGPRFAAGAEQLCAALDQARENLGR
ncbi:MAG TPA: cobalamin-binding protein [Casimicrobiaceae bacterium]|jgi:iron complex transport system substrate-binding protein|nr:cobalamin-binding protein [Casimicrobiaceae bacterium]